MTILLNPSRFAVEAGGGIYDGFSDVQAYYVNDTTTMATTTGGSTEPGNGDNVARWEDQSGNGYHLTEGTNPPQLVTGVQNGEPAVRFDGTNDLLTNSSFFGTASAVHVFMVLRWQASNQGFGNVIISMAPDTSTDAKISDDAFNIGVSGTVYELYWGDGVMSATGTVAPGTDAHLLTMAQEYPASFTSEGFDSEVDGTADITDDYAFYFYGSADLSALRLAANTDSAGGSGFTDIDVFEVVVCSSIQGASAISGFESYVDTKYALSGL